jgi:hypothetical protein
MQKLGQYFPHFEKKKSKALIHGDSKLKWGTSEVKVCAYA